MTCRESEDMTPGAAWCRQCWRYKLDGCEPTQKRLTAHTPRGWQTTGSAGKLAREEHR
jgi:hypothetical protein